MLLYLLPHFHFLILIFQNSILPSQSVHRNFVYSTTSTLFLINSFITSTARFILIIHRYLICFISWIFHVTTSAPLLFTLSKIVTQISLSLISLALLCVCSHCILTFMPSSTYTVTSLSVLHLPYQTNLYFLTSHVL